MTARHDGDRSASIQTDRGYWVWITKPEYYLDALGDEREALEPSTDEDPGDGWWTCHGETRAGDLVLLYRTRPRSDVAYLLEAKSDARVLEIDPPAGSIFQSDFEALVIHGCKKDRELEARRIEVNRLAAELSDLELSRQSSLDTATAGSDKDLAQEWNALLGRADEIERDELEGLAAEVGNSDRIPEGAVEKVRKASIPRWDELERDLDTFEQRASANSASFARFFEIQKHYDALFERSQELLEDFDRAVFSAASLPEDTRVEKDPEFRGSFVCDWVSRYKFEVPLSLADLKADPYLREYWNALRASFKGRSFRMTPEVWSHLIAKAVPNNPGLDAILDKFRQSRVSKDIVTEKMIEDHLRDHLEVLEPKYHLGLYLHPNGQDGQQFQCPEAGGFIDLLCLERETKEFVVIELKAKRAGRNVAGQIKTYMGWVREKLAAGADVRGLIISPGYDRKLRFALSDMPMVDHLDLSEIWPPA